MLPSIIGHREFNDQQKERENRLKSLKQTIIYELLEMKIANLSRDVRGLRIQNHSHDDLERVERLRSLSDRIDCELNRIQEHVMISSSYIFMLWTANQMRRIKFLKPSIDELRKLEDEASAILNKRSVVGEHTVYPPCPPCELEYGRMHLPNSASGTFDCGEFMPKVYIDRGHLVDINQLEISESLTIDSTKNTAEDCTSCSPVTTKNVCSLHPKFQSLLNSLKDATISVPPYVLSCFEQLKIWMGLKADSTKNTEEHYENREVGHFPLPSLPEDNSLTYKDFMCYMRDNMLTVHPRYHVALLVLCNSYLSSQIKNTTAPFENFQWDKTTYYTPPQPLQLTFGEAYDKFFPVIADITMFMSCWFFTLVLIWAVNTGVLQIFSIFLCIAAPCFFFSELARLATKTGVSCGSIKLPAFWFTVLVAVGISSMFVLATLVMSYTRWRLSNGKVKPRVGDVDDAILEGLHEVLQG